MSSPSLDQHPFHTLGQLLSAGGQHDVPNLLKASLERLITFWPAQAGTLIYQAPHGEMITLKYGELDEEAARLISEAREVFGRRSDGSEPAIGYYWLDDDRQLVELSLRSGNQTVGMLHLVVREQDSEYADEPRNEEDMVVLLVRALGGEADKLATLRRAEQDLRELHLLYEIGQSLAANLDLLSLLEDMQKQILKVTGAERCSIMMLDEATNELVLEAAGQSNPMELNEYRISLDRGIAGWVASNGIGQIVNDVEQDPRWYDEIARDIDFVTTSILCVPMRHGERTVGVMQLLNKRGGEPFTEQDLRLMTTLAAQAAVAVENAQLVRSLKQERDRLLAKEAEVRASIARDLHDGPTQSIAAISMNIEFVKRLLRAMPERVEQELDVLLDLVQKTSYDIRTLLFELRPLGLETQGLFSTLEQYVSRFRDPSGLMLRLEVQPGIPKLPVETEGAIFMILQEAVNNARKHAEAPEIIIYLFLEESQLVASVRDLGKGFDISKTEANYTTSGSLGLLNMHERARLIDSELRIRSAEGLGTTVELRVPLE
ncbi:MAG: GAF domain-containing sensor histidine kinase [Chloroflexota bacterium]